MITLKDFMECINYRITDGSDYLWNCFGNNTYQLNSWHGTPDSNTVCVVFDTKTQTVYEMQAWDYANRRTYRWIHPTFIDAVKAEYKKRNLDFTVSIDNETFIDLDVEADILEKGNAISKNLPYDNRVQIELTLEDSEMLQLMTMAHERDLTLNQMVEHILSEMIGKEKLNDRQN
jgi:hypothetical protein